MILNFKPEFKGQILNGQKIHSIRYDQHRKWKPGMVIHFATGSRTKFYNQFWYGHCKSVQDIYIHRHDKNRNEAVLTIIVDGKNLGLEDIAIFAENDGLNIGTFMDFFVPKPGSFKGRIIHWTNKRY